MRGGRFVRHAAVPGMVYLVGAGPGSPDLITVRGLRVLRTADVVLHDALLDPELLGEAKPGAELVHVGKRGYCVGSTKQETINEALLRFARMGKSVCRLKCGDPCVFGRGGEEAEVLAEAGVRVEIVPGVTSATAACAAAGIPLTHRDVGQAVALVTGHHDPDSPECTLDWDALARLPGVVFYMAVRHVARIAARLGDSGLPLDTPAAMVETIMKVTRAAATSDEFKDALKKINTEHAYIEGNEMRDWWEKESAMLAAEVKRIGKIETK